MQATEKHTGHSIIQNMSKHDTQNETNVVEMKEIQTFMLFQ